MARILFKICESSGEEPIGNTRNKETNDTVMKNPAPIAKFRLLPVGLLSAKRLKISPHKELITKVAKSRRSWFISTLVITSNEALSYSLAREGDIASVIEGIGLVIKSCAASHPRTVIQNTNTHRAQCELPFSRVC